VGTNRALCLAPHNPRKSEIVSRPTPRRSKRARHSEPNPLALRVGSKVPRLGQREQRAETFARSPMTNFQMNLAGMLPRQIFAQELRIARQRRISKGGELDLTAIELPFGEEAGRKLSCSSWSSVCG